MTNQPKVTIRHLDIGDDFPVRLMTAVNLSPESFYKGSVIKQTEEEVEAQLSSLASQGTDIFDFGPKSTAPVNIYGEENYVSPKTEIERLKTPLKVFHDLGLGGKHLISVDTQSAEVADYALSNGADLVNDISGLRTDPSLAKVVADHDAALVVMSARHQPGDVSTLPEVTEVLLESLSLAVEAGVNPAKIIFDPGVGGWIPERTPSDDYRLILDVPKLKAELGCPALVALSRKSFIGKVLDLPPSERLPGSLAATAVAVLYGADVVRTHDAVETWQAIRVAEEFRKILAMT